MCTKYVVMYTPPFPLKKVTKTAWKFIEMPKKLHIHTHAFKGIHLDLMQHLKLYPSSWEIEKKS